MKKILAGILSALMCLFLAACEDAPASSSQGSSQPAASTSSSAAAEQSGAEAQSADAVWPTETVTVYVPGEAGSTLDLVCRIQTDYLTRATGYNFVVIDDNTGNGTVAYETVRNAAPDGATMLFTQNIFLQYYADVYTEYPFDVVDAVACGPDSDAGYALALANNLPYKTFDEMITYAKENPGTVKFGIQNGGMAHLLSAILCEQAGIEVKMVEAGSSTEKITAMMGGMVDVSMLAAPTAKPYGESGDLIIVGHTVSKRADAYPDWPTMAELGYPDVVALASPMWYVPKNMDESMRQAINEAFSGMQEDQTVVDSLNSLAYYYNHRQIDECVALLNNYAASMKAGYELAGTSMEGKK